ncbi:MAG: zf-HC2 domain-containing protein [Lachnospiraceae bacterium]|nr:zf-HC2 domain-containing protein [Lachnospiraceae bacterium]
MKNMCDIVQDILPLYVDEICSPSSRTLVDEHIPECEKCSATLERLKRTSIDSSIEQEKNTVLKHHQKATARKTFTVGTITAMILTIPVIVCLIVNLATGHALDWFFIVLTSLLVVASFTVVPLVVSEKAFLYTSLSFVGSILLLLGTCCIYTKGSWFFIAALSVLLGTMTVFLPIIARLYFPNNSFWKKNKGLFVFLTDTVLLYALIIFIGIYVKSQTYWYTAVSITTVCAVSVWLFFLIVRYLPANAFIRAGSAIMYSGVFIAVINGIIDAILGEPQIRLFAKDNIINFELAVSFLAVGLVVLIAGIIRAGVKRKSCKK